MLGSSYQMQRERRLDTEELLIVYVFQAMFGVCILLCWLLWCIVSRYVSTLPISLRYGGAASKTVAHRRYRVPVPNVLEIPGVESRSQTADRTQSIAKGLKIQVGA
jgi:hypothetical protein